MAEKDRSMKGKSPAPGSSSAEQSAKHSSPDSPNASSDSASAVVFSANSSGSHDLRRSFSKVTTYIINVEELPKFHPGGVKLSVKQLSGYVNRPVLVVEGKVMAVSTRVTGGVPCFTLTLKVSGTESTQIKALLFGEEADEFFGCSVRCYQSEDAVGEKIDRMLNLMLNSSSFYPFAVKPDSLVKPRFFCIVDTHMVLM